MRASRIRFTESVERVAGRLSDFDRSVAWYTITYPRELEVQGRLRRRRESVPWRAEGRAG